MAALIQTLGDLRQHAGTRPRPVKQEIRDNLVRKLHTGDRLFPGIIGYDETVIPQLVNAILSRPCSVHSGDGEHSASNTAFGRASAGSSADTIFVSLAVAEEH